MIKTGSEKLHCEKIKASTNWIFKTSGRWLKTVQYIVNLKLKKKIVLNTRPKLNFLACSRFKWSQWYLSFLIMTPNVWHHYNCLGVLVPKKIHICWIVWSGRVQALSVTKSAIGSVWNLLFEIDVTFHHSRNTYIMDGVRKLVGQLFSYGFSDTRINLCYYSPKPYMF